MQAIKVFLMVVCLAGVASAASQPRNSTCDECKAEIGKIKEDLPKFEAENLEKCKQQAKPLQPFCVQLVHEYVKYLSKNTPEQICEDKDFCPHTAAHSGIESRTIRNFIGNSQMTSAENSNECEECKAVFKKIKKNLKKFEHEELERCKLQPKYLQPFCRQLVYEYILYLSEASPEEICEDKGYCPNKAATLVGFSL